MTLQEAIEMQNHILGNALFPFTKDEGTALKLLIEAGKAHLARQRRFPGLPHLRLPGETKN